jgi:phospholipid-translocating ATPase
MAPEMEMKRLHMGTMAFGADTMDEVAYQLAAAFGANPEGAPSFGTAGVLR